MCSTEISVDMLSVVKLLVKKNGNSQILIVAVMIFVECIYIYTYNMCMYISTYK